MSHEITLPSGETAVIKDVDDLTYGDREDFLAAIRVDFDGKAQGVTGGRVLADMERCLLIAGIESWTVTDPRTGATLPVPSVSSKAMRQVRAKDMAMLAEKLRPLQPALFPEDFGPQAKADPETGALVPDTESPTTPSVASNTL